MVRKRPSRIEKRLNQKANSISALSDSLLGFGRGDVGTSQLSQTDTLYKNNRYYLLTIQRTVLDYLYNEHGIIQTMIDQPVEDGFRGGVVIESGELDAENIDELQKYMVDHNVIEHVKEAFKWNRLFGGAGLIINTEQDPSKPFNPRWINKDTQLEFYPADRWELTYSGPDTWSGYEFELMNKDIGEDKYNYYGVDIDASRVLRLKGKRPSSFVRRQLQGWGISELERIVRPFNQYLKNNNLIFELIDEAKIDVYQIDGYNASLMNGNASRIKDQVEFTNQTKNFLNAILLDKDDSYEQKQFSFGGLSEILKENRMEIAAALKMPMTKIFGISASGFNSGEDDIENYNAMVESEIRQKAIPMLNTIIKIISLKLFGFEPSLNIGFEPLRIMTAEQEENVKTQKTTRMTSMYDRGLIDSEEAMQFADKENLLGIKTKGSDGELPDQPTPPIQQPRVTITEDKNVNLKDI